MWSIVRRRWGVFNVGGGAGLRDRLLGPPTLTEGEGGVSGLGWGRWQGGGGRRPSFFLPTKYSLCPKLKEKMSTMGGDPRIGREPELALVGPPHRNRQWPRGKLQESALVGAEINKPMVATAGGGLRYQPKHLGVAVLLGTCEKLKTPRSRVMIGGYEASGKCHQADGLGLDQSDWDAGPGPSAGEGGGVEGIRDNGRRTEGSRRPLPPCVSGAVAALTRRRQGGMGMGMEGGGGDRGWDTPRPPCDG